jgi:hypothetical protein
MTITQQNTYLDAALALWPRASLADAPAITKVATLWSFSHGAVPNALVGQNADLLTALQSLATSLRTRSWANLPQANATVLNYTVALATTANITLSGEQTIDGVLTSTSRVLVKNQTTASQNGIYVSGSGAWTRATDYNTSAEIANSLVTADDGTIGAYSTWSQPLTTVVVGTTALSFVLDTQGSEWNAVLVYLDSVIGT